MFIVIQVARIDANAPSVQAFALNANYE